MEPLFLELFEVIEIHQDQIERYGGRTGIRDLGLLQSALAVPRSGYKDQYFHPDLYEMAAAYLFHIVRNHPFIDGNKRVGLMSAFNFLKLNGIILTASGPALEKIVRDVAGGKAQKEKLAAFFRKHSEKSHD